MIANSVGGRIEKSNYMADDCWVVVRQMDNPGLRLLSLT